MIDKWEHSLRWKYEATGCDITHTVNEYSEPDELRKMIELCGVTAERCRRELAEAGEA